MKKEYDFSKSVKNPYFKALQRQKRQITLELESSVLEKLQAIATQRGISQNTLINEYLSEKVGIHRTAR